MASGHRKFNVHCGHTQYLHVEAEERWAVFAHMHGAVIRGRVDADGADVAVQIVYDLNGIGVVQVGNDVVSSANLRKDSSRFSMVLKNSRWSASTFRSTEI